MAIKLKVSENQARVSLRANDGSPYYVGARAYVTQTAGGATITVIDKEGTTTADISNGYTTFTDDGDGNITISV